MGSRTHISFLSSILTGLIVFSSLAFADLGGKLHEGKNLRKIKSNTAYTVHEFELNGSTIHEYLSGAKVFAVTWVGPTQPDLSSLLGDYVGEYGLAVKQTARVRGQRAQSQVMGDHIVVEKSGHMQAMKGRAYLPLEIPKGVSLNEIR